MTCWLLLFETHLIVGIDLEYESDERGTGSSKVYVIRVRFVNIIFVKLDIRILYRQRWYCIPGSAEFHRKILGES